MAARDPTGNWSTVEQQINSIQAYLGVYETPLLTVTLTYQHSSHPPAPPFLFPETQECIATTNIRAGTLHPNVKPNSLPPPRIHPNRQSPMGNASTESTTRRWPARIAIWTALFFKSRIFMPVRGSQRRRKIYAISRGNRRIRPG